MDLDAYFRRIDYTGARSPALKTLQAIHARHAEAIAFENLDPWLNRPVRLDPDSIQRKLVRDGRGGYCYEHNLLLSHVLNALGFQVTGLAAQVLWNGANTGRSHMLLRVDIDGRSYIADVGFGGLTLTASLRLEQDIEQATPHEPFRLLKADGDFILQARLRGAWKPLYRFDLQEQLLSDYEIRNWYTSTHPDSPFVTGLIAARPDRGLRYALANNELRIHHLNGHTERHMLVSVAELRSTLERVFRLTLPKIPELDLALSEIVQGGSADELDHIAFQS